jgi:SHS2 domain-containing protein
LHASLEGAQLVSIDKEIKAVTYHNIAIKKTPRGLQVRIVFDV